jgi:aromatic ring-opening dioxygenase catalytic subunit (LigB family)
VLIGPGKSAESELFDRWLTDTLAQNSDTRTAALIDWAKAPGAVASHPREEHLAPVFVAAGAAEGQAGRCVYTDNVLGAAVSAYQFG